MFLFASIKFGTNENKPPSGLKNSASSKGSDGDTNEHLATSAVNRAKAHLICLVGNTLQNASYFVGEIDTDTTENEPKL